MSALFNRRAALAGLWSSAATLALADAPGQSPRPRVRTAQAVATSTPTWRPLSRPSTADMVTQADLGGAVGFVLADLRDGSVLESHAADVGLPPASVMKTVTTLYALDALGRGFRFATRLLATGPLADGVVQGDLVLAGGGDPQLVTDDLVTLAADLRAAGVTGITGRFLIWEGALPYLNELEPGQLDHFGYNPALSGLNLNFNRVNFAWKRQGADYAVTMDARSETVVPAVSMARVEVVDRATPLFTYRDGGGRDDWTVARAALGNAGSRQLPVRFPGAYAGDVFRTVARSAGVILPEAVVVPDLPEGREVARHESPVLTDILRDMLKYSTNLTAEVLGLTATRARTGQARGQRTSALGMEIWARAKAAAQIVCADHSGLSDASHVSAGDMVRLLTAPGVPAALRPLLKRIAMLDTQGDLLRGVAGAVVAKTGTLDFVTALAGYQRSASGQQAAFAIFAANDERRAVAKAQGVDQPEGAAAWNTRARRLQQRLLQRWAMR